MVDSPRLSAFARAYVLSIGALGLIVISASVYQLFHEPVAARWFMLAGLTLLSGSATVQLPSSHASISISEVFVFIAILLYGPAAGTVVVALDGLVISFWIAKRHREAYRALFNMSAPALAAWCSAQLFFLTAHVEPLAKSPATINRILPFVALSAIVYFCLNTWLIAFAISLERRVNALKLWRSKFAWLSLTYVGGASVAVLVAVYDPTLDFNFFGVIVPLLLVLYFTFRTTMGRLEDSDRHVVQLNKLYLSTIETLAMAIDAKDQVTHGHIRRVQSHAVFLAKSLGVKDEELIRAVEAAALLHDTGKLAVPEYILNKPGRLTPAEFEKMKLHASIGADILSAIAFPYPVVPIVRHHHENWDGSGYPSGLSGPDIPLGARILSVVDCFDALTSDRPYRPRFSDEDALRIVMERRGSMYDPVIVDAFVRVHREMLASEVRTDVNVSQSETANTSGKLPEPNAPSLSEITASSHEMATMHALSRALASMTSASEMSDVVSSHLRRLVPSSLVAFFVYDARTSELEIAHAFGEASSTIRGLRIPLGQRLSGWVAVNRQTIVNSDPSLDLGEIARAVTPALRSCMSTPLTSDRQLLGVLTVYSAIADGYRENHRRIIETIGEEVSRSFARATDIGTPSKSDSHPGSTKKPGSIRDLVH